MEKDKKIKEKNLQEKIERVWDPKKNDPNGSYTGTSEDEGKPVQDADDL